MQGWNNSKQHAGRHGGDEGKAKDTEIDSHFLQTRNARRRDPAQQTCSRACERKSDPAAKQPE